METESGSESQQDGSIAESSADERSRLEIEKLRLEISDLKRGGARSFVAYAQAIATALLTLIIAIGGWRLQNSLDLRSTRDELYSRALGDFDSKDASLRVRGTLTLRDYVDSDDKGVQTISILTERLLRETDPSAINTLLEVDSSLPVAALDPLIRVNRRAAFDFARSAGRFARVVPVSAPVVAAFGSYEAGLHKLDRYMESMAPELPLGADDPSRSWHMANVYGLLHMDPFQSYADAEYHLRSDIQTYVGNVPLPPGESVNVYSDIYARAVALAASGNALTGLIENTHFVPPGTDMSGIVLLNVNALRDVSLKGVNMKGSYLYGVAECLDLSYSDLTGTNMGLLQLSHSTLRMAELKEAVLPIDDGTVDWAGADWWNGSERKTDFYYDLHVSTPEHKTSYPRDRNEKLRARSDSAERYQPSDMKCPRSAEQ